MKAFASAISRASCADMRASASVPKNEEPAASVTSEGIVGELGKLRID
jgi:hypothetical protein